MKTQGKRGGTRPNSGPKVDIEKNLILYDIALSFNVGLDRARRLLSQWRNRPAVVIGEKRCRKLRKFAASENAHEYLAVIRQSYLRAVRRTGIEAMNEDEADLESIRAIGDRLVDHYELQIAKDAMKLMEHMAAWSRTRGWPT